MQKGTKVALVVFAGLCLVGIAGFWSLLNNTNKALDRTKKEAVTAGNEILVLLAGRWKYEDFELRTAPGFPPAAKAQPELDRLRAGFGGLVSGECRLEGFHPDTDDVGPILRATVSADCEFENGRASVRLYLSRRPQNAWMLESYEVARL